jgi:hypothetical protein
VIVPHSASDEDIENLFLKVWQLYRPDLALQIISLSIDDNFKTETINNIKSVLTRSVIKKGKTWFLTEGRESKVSSMLGEIASLPGQFLFTLSIFFSLFLFFSTKKQEI